MKHIYIYIFYKRKWIYFTFCTKVCQVSVFRCYVKCSLLWVCGSQFHWRLSWLRLLYFSQVLQTVSTALYGSWHHCHSNRGETFLENVIRKPWNNSGGLYINGRIGLIFTIIVLIIIIIIIMYWERIHGKPQQCKLQDKVYFIEGRF